MELVYRVDPITGEKILINPIYQIKKCVNTNDCGFFTRSKSRTKCPRCGYPLKFKEADEE